MCRASRKTASVHVRCVLWRCSWCDSWYRFTLHVRCIESTGGFRIAFVLLPHRREGAVASVQGWWRLQHCVMARRSGAGRGDRTGSPMTIASRQSLFRQGDCRAGREAGAALVRYRHRGDHLLSCPEQSRFVQRIDGAKSCAGHPAASMIFRGGEVF